jgi:dihydroorotase
MCHAPAKLFGVKDRGFIRKGYFADLVLVDPNKPYTVSSDNILYKCGWSPLEGETLSSSVVMTILNGKIVFQDGRVIDEPSGEMLEFVR